MKTKKIIMLLLNGTLIISACNDKPNSTSNQSASDNPQTQTTELIQQNTSNQSASVNPQTQTTESIQQSTSSSTGVQGELDKAKKAGKAVFVVVTGTSSSDTDKALTIAKGANAINKNATIIQMNRDDASNAQLVNEWRLAGAPLPLILVISPKGMLTGGLILAQATAENIAAMVPSPKMEDVYAAIGSGKPAIVVLSMKSFTDKTEVLKVCKEAVSILKNNAVIVEVDMDDSKEVNFINQLRVNKSLVKASVVLVINKQGQVSGTATTMPDAKKLASAATQVLKGGCGPGCGPAGCGK